MRWVCSSVVGVLGVGVLGVGVAREVHGACRWG